MEHKRESEKHKDEAVVSENPIDTLQDELLEEVFRILGKGYFRMVAGTCKRFHSIYKRVHADCTTLAEELVQSSVASASLFCKEAELSGSLFKFWHTNPNWFALPPIITLITGLITFLLNLSFRWQPFMVVWIS